jgi:hypothetical protein
MRNLRGQTSGGNWSGLREQTRSAPLLKLTVESVATSATSRAYFMVKWMKITMTFAPPASVKAR